MCSVVLEKWSAGGDRALHARAMFPFRGGGGGPGTYFVGSMMEISGMRAVVVPSAP